MAGRSPMNVITRETIPVGEWRHVLVSCDGSTTARGLRVFLDGEECFCDVLHDNFPEIAVSEAPKMGGETNSAGFKGSLADAKLIAKPQLAELITVCETGSHESCAIDGGGKQIEASNRYSLGAACWSRKKASIGPRQTRLVRHEPRYWRSNAMRRPRW